MHQPALPSPTISDYGVVGNLHTAALICRHGSIDFMCYPRFDSPSMFTRLLQDKDGGHFALTLSEEHSHSTQQYLPGTAVLVTRHHHRGGIVEVTDFMPPSTDVEHCQLIRKVEAITGTSQLACSLQVAWPYGKTELGPAQAKDVPTELDAKGQTYDLGASEVHVFSSHSQHTTDDYSFSLSAGDDPVYYLLQSSTCTTGETTLASFCESLLQTSREFWTAWTSRITYNGEHRDLVIRSAITLKLCISAQFGSSVAAVTTSLPESVGGGLNWDYRYSWIRDSAFSMYAMLRLGLSEEADQFIKWIEQRCQELSDASDLGLMYRVDGGTDLEEKELSHLDGYRDSTPVRIGNGAAGQRQLDIYGELIDTVYLYDRYGNEITFAFWQHLVAIIDYVVESWREPDHGIWEARGEKKQYTASKLMAWVAIDRGIRIAQHRGFPAPHQKWLAARDELYTYLYEEHYNEDIDAWTKTASSTEVDGSLLMMPLVRFVMTEEPAWQNTLKRIEEKLVDGCLVYRNESKELQTGYDGTEGYFAMCSFWYIEVLAKSGRVSEARDLMAKMAAYANPLGLYSEEISMRGELIGNYPQAFTHLGFISAALKIAEELDQPSTPTKATRR